jgi:hypothetical protein
MNGPRQRQADLPNVLRLYEELGVHPEEGLARLTERYRQRLRALHPDRGGDEGGAGLGWLTRSYRDAVAFEREHGRLPGASTGEGVAGGTGGHDARPAAGGTLRRVRLRRGGGGSRWRWLLAGMALGALLFAGAGELRHRLLLDARPMEPLATIRIGSTPEEVMRIQGPPYERRGQRWHYGASWIAFDAGRVVGWHSARQYPLQVDEPDAAPRE